MRMLSSVFFTTFFLLASSSHLFCQEKEESVGLQRLIQAASSNAPQLRSALKKVPQEHKKAMIFLIENMPVKDAQHLSADFLLSEVKWAYVARKHFDWASKVPEAIFFNDVLAYACLDEARDPWRKVFFQRFAPLLRAAKSQKEAIELINHALVKELNVNYNTQRKKANQSPQESISQGMASCTGLSILLVDALRSVGIPARIAGTPSWTTKRGNHNWVEVWCLEDRQWHFTEYYPDAKGLDHGWLLADAAQGDTSDWLTAIYASSWKKTRVFFPLVWDLSNRSVSAINVTERYKTLALEQGILPKKDTCQLRIEYRRGGIRKPVELRIIQANGKELRGITPSAQEDANNFLTFSLPKGVACKVLWQQHEGWGEKQLQLPQKEPFFHLFLRE